MGIKLVTEPLTDNKCLILREWLDSVDEGWAPLLHYADKVFRRVLEETPTGEISILQVKEKFGGLRLYIATKGLTEAQDDRLDNLISALEGLSYHICEKCGKLGEAAGKSWIKTLCPEHHAERADEGL